MAANGFLAFSGSNLDRMAHLRGTPDATPRAQDVSIVLWRGKILVDIAADHSVVRLDSLHPELAGQPYIFFWAKMWVGAVSRRIYRRGNLKRALTPIPLFFLIPRSSGIQVFQKTLFL
jgi:hypothetical protein